MGKVAGRGGLRVDQTRALDAASTWAMRDSSVEARRFINLLERFNVHAQRADRQDEMWSRLRDVELNAGRVYERLQMGEASEDDMRRALDVCSTAYERECKNLKEGK